MVEAAAIVPAPGPAPWPGPPPAPRRTADVYAVSVPAGVFTGDFYHLADDRDGVWFAGKWRWLQACRHGGLDESRFDTDDVKAAGAKLVIESL